MAKQLIKKPANLKNATLDTVLSSNDVLDEANIERRTAGVTGIPPLSPGGGGGWNGRGREEGGIGFLGVADEEDEDGIMVLPGVTVDEVEDMVVELLLSL